jgi:death-on-curing protein
MTAHVRLVKEFGGGVGVRDVGLIESALHGPLASYEGKLQYQTPFERAAVLWLGLIRNHGFVDANERTATAAMARWLVAEDYRLRSGQDELVDMAVAMANEELEVGEVAAWLEAHSEPGQNQYMRSRGDDVGVAPEEVGR